MDCASICADLSARLHLGETRLITRDGLDAAAPIDPNVARARCELLCGDLASKCHEPVCDVDGFARVVDRCTRVPGIEVFSS